MAPPYCRIPGAFDPAAVLSRLQKPWISQNVPTSNCILYIRVYIYMYTHYYTLWYIDIYIYIYININIYIYCVCVYTHRYNILSNYVYYMNLHLENFNKLETRDRWTATVFTSSSSVVQIILTNSSRGGWHVTDTWLSDQSADIYVGHDFWLRKLNQCCSSNCLSLSLSCRNEPQGLDVCPQVFLWGIRD